MAIIEINSVEQQTGTYSVEVLSGALCRVPGFLAKLSDPQSRRLLVLSNDTVFEIYGDEFVAELKKSGFEVNTWLLPEGEEYKNLDLISKALEYFCKVRLNRRDIVVGFGGGVVGDFAGFAASIFMRGIAFVQIPTTLLAMVDSAVGGKTGVNNEFGKNIIGSFRNPIGVFADTDVLKTLPVREFQAGYYELVKHGAIGGEELLLMTSGFIRDFPISDYSAHWTKPDFSKRLNDLIAAHVKQKADVVYGDPTEDPERGDAESRKILNFGHTVAHALETATNYGFFRHGEAVGYGILAANEIAKRLEYCDVDSINLLNDVVHSVGKLPDAGAINVDSVFDALAADKKSVGSAPQWVLLKRIGLPGIIPGESVPADIVKESISKVLLT